MIARSCSLNISPILPVPDSNTGDDSHLLDELSPLVFTSVVYALITSIDYCNSLHIGLPELRLPSLQLILNASKRLIVKHYLSYLQDILRLSSNLTL